MHTSESQRTEVESNYRAFVSDLPKLVQSNKGKFALYRHERFVDAFPTFSDAMAHGTHAYDDRIFSVQEITEEPLDLGGLPYASDSGDVRSERSQERASC
jgi:hypothetical protein